MPTESQISPSTSSRHSSLAGSDRFTIKCLPTPDLVMDSFTIQSRTPGLEKSCRLSEMRPVDSATVCRTFGRLAVASHESQHSTVASLPGIYERDFGPTEPNFLAGATPID